MIDRNEHKHRTVLLGSQYANKYHNNKHKEHLGGIKGVIMIKLAHFDRVMKVNCHLSLIIFSEKESHLGR